MGGVLRRPRPRPRRPRGRPGPGQKWTGWHRLEKDLWPERAKVYRPLSAAQRQDYADHLLDKTRELDGRIQDLDITVEQITKTAPVG